MRQHTLVRCLGAALLLTLFFGLLAPLRACAAPPEEADTELAGRFEGKSWEDVMSEFFDKWGIYEGSVGIGYYNTVTGEERYINADKYFHAASLYKLPLNMYYAEKVYNGEMAMDELICGIPYDYIQTNSVQYSSNPLSEMLQADIGTYREYKEAIAKYLCDDPEELSYPYYSENYFTASHFIHALKMLYEEPERYPDVLELMKLATPNSYFALKEDRFVIAHKYGYFVGEGLSSLNDAAVIYTDEPILLVLLSDFMSGGAYSMAELCTLMCDYTQYGHRIREQEAALAAQETSEQEPDAESAPAAQVSAPSTKHVAYPLSASVQEAQPRQTQQADAPQWNVAAIAAMGAVFLLALVLSLVFLKNAWRYLVPSAAALLFALGLFLFGVSSPQADVMPGETDAPVSVQEAVPEPTPAPAPAPTPAPEPEPTPEPVREVVLTGSGPEEVLALLDIDTLEHVDATASTCYDELLELAGAKPECVIDWTVDLGGVTVPNSAEAADVRGAEISSAELAEKLRYLPELKTADICELGYTNEQSLEIIERYPDIDFTWTVNFGRWAVRSDICVFSTLQSGAPGYRYNDGDLAPLFTYCTQLAALDLGHNAVTDLAPIAGLEKLQVLIIPDNRGLADITPLGDMKELRYLELFLDGDIEDFSALEKLTKMVDINLSYAANLRDAGFLENMPELRMGWFKATGIPSEEWAPLQEAHPDAKLLFYYPNSVSSTCDDWRATERNIAIRKAFTNWADVISFEGWDKVEYREGAVLTETYASYEYN